ncbi:MAG: prepilin peptidase [Hyphomicrobiales bacterium]
MLQSVALTLFPLLVVVCGLFDFFTLRIPNWLNGVTAVAFVLCALSVAMPLPVLGMHVLAGIILLIFGFALFAGNFIGGGDAKMLAATGLWIGWTPIVPFLVFTAIAGGVLGVVMLILRSTQRYLQFTGIDSFAPFVSKKIDLPYGMAIAAGAVLVLPETWWFTGLN